MTMRSTTRSLDFVVIGAQKAGTTSLFEYMRTHPELYLPPGKEEQFFTAEVVYRRGWESYVSQVFYRAPEQALWGTATPQYMSGGAWDEDGRPVRLDGTPAERVVPARIRALMPGCRLIAILRDPVERCLSHYEMLLLLGMEHRSFDDVLEELLTPENLDQARAEPHELTGCVVRGEYSRILTPYYDELGSGQLCVLFSGELAAAPEVVIRSVFDFLGVDSAFIPPNLGQRFREGSVQPRSAMLEPNRVWSALARRRWVHRVWRTVPVSARRPVQHLTARATYRASLWNRVHNAPRAQMSDEARAALRAHYRADRDALVRLIGREVPW